jgi:VWFA-related protein
MNRVRVFSGASVLLALGFVVSARQTAPQQSPPPRFSAGVDIVEMDVSVLDKDHKPVRGLTAKDFTVLEDGAPQKIVAFDEVHVPPPAPPTAAWKRDVPVDVQSSAIAEKQLFVIIVDDAQIAPSAAISATARPGEENGRGRRSGTAAEDPMMRDAAYRLATTRGVARKAIESLGENDLAAIIFTQDNFKGQTFTSDRSKLLKTLDGLALGPAYHAYPLAPEATDCQPLWFTTGALRMAVEALSAMPHRRKTILYVSAGLYIPLIGKPPPEYEICAAKAQDSVLEAFRMAQLSNVNIYTIDPSGLEVAQGLALDQLRGRHNFLLEVAENTGGRAILDTNDDVGRVAEILDDARSYYVLGYELTNRKGDGKFHRVEVKVNRPGVEVLSRKTRYDAPPPKPGTAAAVVSANNVVGEFLPKGDIPAELSVSAFSTASGGRVVVVIGGHLPPLSAPLTSDHLDLVIRAFTPDGRDAGAHQELVPVILRPVATAADQPGSGPAFELASRIDLRPGRYSLRIGLRSAATDKAGSVYADVEVPDFTKDSLSLSGAVFTASSGTSRGDALSAIVPTISREFAADDRMQVFVRAYQGGATPLADASMRTRIVDAHNATAFDHTEILPAQAFARGRQADYFVRLPLTSLKPGEYWLAIEAKSGRAAARRDVRFTVKPVK